MRTRRRITTTVFEHDGHRFTITMTPDGLHVREKYQRGDRVISFQELVTGSQTAKSANRKLKDNSPSEVLDVTACDLCILSEAMNSKEKVDKRMLSEIVKSLLRSLKIVRSLEALA